LTLTYDLDLQSQASYGHDPHTHRNNFNGQKIGWKKLTDRQTDATDRFSFPANAVGDESQLPTALRSPYQKF